MALKLYMIESSPPCRSVLLTAKALDVELEKVFLNIRNEEHLAPEFLKLNPQHTVPTLVDDDGSLWDSHAIMVYLAEKYGKDDRLYPKNSYKRAIINQRLHFDSGCLFAPFRAAVIPILFKGTKSVAPDVAETMKEGYNFLEKFLEGRLWVTGTELTLADLSMIPTVTSMDVLLPIDPNLYPNIAAWIKRAQALGCYKENVSGLENLRKYIHSFLV